ncbi:MAG: hypothetical protein ACREBU_02460 [Nitrososphaera sp.]
MNTEQIAAEEKRKRAKLLDILLNESVEIFTLNGCTPKQLLELSTQLLTNLELAVGHCERLERHIAVLQEALEQKRGRLN